MINNFVLLLQNKQELQNESYSWLLPRKLNLNWDKKYDESDTNPPFHQGKYIVSLTM